MTTTRTTQGIEISRIINGQRLHRHYIGYNAREARKLFTRFVTGYRQGLEDAKLKTDQVI